MILADGCLGRCGWLRWNMLGSEYSGQNCSLARTLEVVGERWTLLIVRELIRRPNRFSVLQRRLGVAKNVLAARLDKLVAHHIVEKVEVERARDWNDYRLTAKGRDLYPVVGALMAWGDAHAAPDGKPVIVYHSCGGPAGHRLVCEECGEVVDASSIHAHAGPGWKGDDDEWDAVDEAPHGAERTATSAAVA